MATKNLFDYATKELSQDAFLRWLFENYNCGVEGVQKVCYKVLSTLIKHKINDGEIKDLQTYAQDFKIDVIVFFKMKSTRYLIAIEDKVFSGEHDQLDDYTKALNKIEANKVYHEHHFDNVIIRKVFYKTDIKDPDEIERVNKAGWRPLYIEDIYKEIFEEFIVNGEAILTGSEILDQYINRIYDLYKSLTDVSKKDVKEWKSINFRSYLMNKIKPYANEVAKKKCVILDAKEWSWQGHYISLGLVHHFPITSNRHPCIKFSMEIVAREHDDPEKGELSVSLRLSRLERETDEKTKKRQELLLEDADPVRAGMKNIIENLDPSNGCRLFKLMNHKACIATDSDELRTQLLFSNEFITIDKSIKEAIDSFIDICSYSYEEIRKQDVPEYNEPDFNYIIIKVRKGYVENDTKENRNAKNSRYNVTRRCWVIAEYRRNTDNYKYVLSVSNGIVYEVYEIKEWKKAAGTDNRYEFDGVVAPWKVRNHFLGKLLPEKYRKKGLASPLLYYDAQSSKEGQEDQN